MQGMGAVFKREFQGYFATPVANRRRSAAHAAIKPRAARVAWINLLGTP